MFAQSLARTAQIFGTRPAVISPTGKETRREYSDQNEFVAKGLRNLGLEPGDRVAVLAENSVGHLPIMYAVAWAGCVLVPLNTRLSPHEMTQIAKEAGVAALAGDSKNKNAFLSLVGAVDQTLELIDLDGDTGLGAPLAELVDNDGLDPWKAEMSDIAALFYTGGTPGRTKGVMVREGALTVQKKNLVNDMSI